MFISNQSLEMPEGPERKPLRKFILKRGNTGIKTFSDVDGRNSGE
jgi:hypothetical protein